MMYVEQELSEKFAKLISFVKDTELLISSLVVAEQRKQRAGSSSQPAAAATAAGAASGSNPPPAAAAAKEVELDFSGKIDSGVCTRVSVC